jgi:hypothetical protein
MHQGRYPGAIFKMEKNASVQFEDGINIKFFKAFCITLEALISYQDLILLKVRGSASVRVIPILLRMVLKVFYSLVITMERVSIDSRGAVPLGALGFTKDTCGQT